MGPPSYMRSVAHRNVVLRRIPVLNELRGPTVGCSWPAKCLGDVAQMYVILIQHVQRSEFPEITCHWQHTKVKHVQLRIYWYHNDDRINARGSRNWSHPIHRPAITVPCQLPSVLCLRLHILLICFALYGLVWGEVRWGEVKWSEVELTWSGFKVEFLEIKCHIH
jgi:hypothetical protein